MGFLLFSYMVILFFSSALGVPLWFPFLALLSLPLVPFLALVSPAWFPSSLWIVAPQFSSNFYFIARSGRGSRASPLYIWGTYF